jgi:hypothetical protein
MTGAFPDDARRGVMRYVTSYRMLILADSLDRELGQEGDK